MALQSLTPWRRNTSLRSSSDPLASEAEASLSSLQREMNRMFNNIWSTPILGVMTSGRPQSQSSSFCPALEMSETDGHIEVSAEIPGVSEKDIDLTISANGRSLTIRGEKKFAENKDKQKDTQKQKDNREARKNRDYYCAERAYGEFKRTVELPCEVDANDVDAKFHNGVLEVVLTKAESSSNVKHIDVKAS